MPLTERRPPLFLLSLPSSFTKSSSRSPSKSSPITPRNSTPTQYAAPRRDNSRPRTSTDSWNSVQSQDNDEVEWAQHHVALLVQTLENLPSTVLTPFDGSVPPNNLLDKVAKSIKDAKGQEWPHSVRATRQMLIQLAKKMNSSPIQEESPAALKSPHSKLSTPVKGSPLSKTSTVAPKVPPPIKRTHRRKPQRKNSMDFIPPSSVSSNASITRAAIRLHRSERFFAIHPYANARHSSRSPSPPLSDAEPISSPAIQHIIPAPIPRLRRSSSTTNVVPELTITTSLEPPLPMLSLHALGSQSFCQGLTPDYLPSSITHRISNPCIARVRRSESFTRPISMGPTVFSAYHPPTTGNGCTQPHLKRLPSYGVVNQQAKAVKKEEKAKDQGRPKNKTVVAQASGGESSDEEEKQRQKTVKRMKTLHRVPSYMGAELPKAKVLVSESVESLLGPVPSLCSSASASTIRSQTSSKSSTSHKSASSTPKQASSSRKANTPRGPILSDSPAPMSSPSSPGDSPKPRTLRRVKVQHFRCSNELPLSGPPSPATGLPPARPPLRPLAGLGRQLSFGSPRSSKTSETIALGENLLGGLNSPFEEKRFKLRDPGEVKSRGGAKYLF